MTSDTPRTMHPYEVEYDSGGTVAFRNFEAYEIVHGDGLIRFLDASGALVFAVSAGHIISVNRRVVARSPKSIVDEVITKINEAVTRHGSWLNI